MIHYFAMTSNENDELMTVQDVADKLRISPKTVRNRTSLGLIPSVKIGGARRYERQAIEAMIVAGREERVAS